MWWAIFITYLLPSSAVPTSMVVPCKCGATDHHLKNLKANQEGKFPTSERASPSGSSKPNPRKPNSPRENLRVEIPGCYTPASQLQKAATAPKFRLVKSEYRKK